MPTERPDRMAAAYLSADEYDRLKALADSNHRSVAGELRRIIAKELETTTEGEREAA